MIETVGLAGAEMVVYQLAEELRSRGHTVNAVVPEGREGWLVDALREAGIPYHGYDLRRPLDHGLPFRLAALLRRLRVDVVHSHEFVMSFYGAAATTILRVPQIITMHGNQGMTKRLRDRVALRFAFGRSDHVVAVSQDTGRHLESRLGLREGQVKVVLNGITSRLGDRHATRKAFGIGENDVLMLAVGNLIERKGHAVLLQALALLPGLGVSAPWRLLIAGGGEQRPRLEQLIDELRLTDRVELLGSRTDVPDLQAAADVFVMPSLWEGLPLAILEAMFAQNAVIASNISGIPEAIRNDVDGLLVPAGDVPALAEAIASVLRDPSRRAQLASAGCARANQEFTIDAMTSAYESLYGVGSRVAPAPAVASL